MLISIASSFMWSSKAIECVLSFQSPFLCNSLELQHFSSSQFLLFPSPEATFPCTLGFQHMKLVRTQTFRLQQQCWQFIFTGNESSFYFTPIQTCIWIYYMALSYPIFSELITIQKFVLIILWLFKKINNLKHIDR